MIVPRKNWRFTQLITIKFVMGVNIRSWHGADVAKSVYVNQRGAGHPLTLFELCVHQSVSMGNIHLSCR